LNRSDIRDNRNNRDIRENKNDKAEKLIMKPLAQKCWPEISIFVQKIRVSLTLRPILEHTS